MGYQNPVIPGFYPDPSVCRVGEDYYLVNSSFEYFPGVPIFHSRDLIHWRQIGHCLTRPSQLPMDGAASSQGIYAPTIRHHQGRFYVVTTNVSGGGHFYVTAANPAGPWSEPIWVDGGGIDPSLFFDWDGKVYFTSTAPDGFSPGIYQSEINIATGRRLTEPACIWKGTGGMHPEGPHLYRIDGIYYLLIAEGGTEHGHTVTIARSQGPWGPFVGCPHNPILTHRSLPSPIQATGHADLVQAHDGTWWLVCLGIRPVYYPPRHHLGRETFLAPVTWTSDCWPVVGHNGTIALEMDLPTLPLHPWEAAPDCDDFDSATLGLAWNFRRNPVDEDWSLTARPGWLRLNGPARGPGFVGRRQQHFDCRAAALLDFNPSVDGEEAGLTAIMNEEFHYDLAVTREGGRRCLIFRRTLAGLSKVEYCAPLPSGLVELIVTADRHTYRFAYRVDGGSPVPFGEAACCYLATEVAGGFTGVYLGVYATGNGRRSSTPADFDWIAYTWAWS